MPIKIIFVKIKRLLSANGKKDQEDGFLMIFLLRMQTFIYGKNAKIKFVVTLKLKINLLSPLSNSVSEFFLKIIKIIR